LYHKETKKNRYYATSIQISGSGQIVRLISGTIRFRPDFKNCYPVHPYLKCRNSCSEKCLRGLVSLEVFSIGTVAAYSAKYSALVAYKTLERFQY